MERETKKGCFGFSWADEVEKEEQWKGDSDGMIPNRKSNPFGSARPREVVLEEKGVDWRKFDQNLDYKPSDTTRKNEKPKENIHSRADSMALGSRYLDPNKVQSQSISPLVPPLRYLPKNMQWGCSDVWNPGHSNQHSTMTQPCRIPNTEHISSSGNTDSRGKRKWLGEISRSPHEEMKSIERRNVLADLNLQREVRYERPRVRYGTGRRLNNNVYGNHMEHGVGGIEWERVYQLYSNTRRERSNAQSRRN